MKTHCLVIKMPSSIILGLKLISNQHLSKKLPAFTVLPTGHVTRSASQSIGSYRSIHDGICQASTSVMAFLIHTQLAMNYCSLLDSSKLGSKENGLSAINPQLTMS
jgi:hypothetical protein